MLRYIQELKIYSRIFKYVQEFKKYIQEFVAFLLRGGRNAPTNLPPPIITWWAQRAYCVNYFNTCVVHLDLIGVACVCS
jgi:hypothetical protein